MAVPSELFTKGDVYINYPQEDVMFHFQHTTGKVFRKFYWRPLEDEIPHSSTIFAESRTYGTAVDAEQYRNCNGHGTREVGDQR